MKKQIYFFLLVLTFTLLTVVGCGGKAKKQDIATRKVDVVATTGMIGDAAKNVGGERASVITLMGPGVDPHLYKAGEGDVTRMTNADIIFYNGLHLEGKMTEVLERMESNIKTVAVAGTFSDEDLLSVQGGAGTHDPHIWFDVPLWMKTVVQVREAFIEVDPTHRELYEVQAAEYLSQLEDLHGLLEKKASELKPEQRVLITAHDAFNYFGRRYGFEVRGLQGISTASEAGTADVQELAKFIAERKIPAIFVESSIPVRTIKAVQQAVNAKGFKVEIGGELFSDAMGNTGTAEGTYIGMVKHNMNTIVDALAGKTAANKH
ncbi:zinc ABC transporter substrate-binding protein [bacterium]|nr:zinc ABC transporter substrate-binding protein [bacterium]